MDITQSPSWQSLGAHAKKIGQRHLRSFFADDPRRVSRLTFELDGLLVDFSKQRIDP